MANDKKFIVKNGLRADNVEFTDSQSGSNQITLNMLNTDTLNFEGDAGTLFGISDDLTGIVFSVNDVSGIPILEVDGDTHNVSLAEYDGKVMIGGTDSGSTDSDVLNVTGNVKATAFIGPLTGNATTASTLETARDIGGVSFNGSASINLPGVNTSGNQNTSGTAAIATAVTVADESTDTTCFPLFATASSGNLEPKSGSNLTFNSSSGLLTATTFSGSAASLSQIPMGEASGTLAAANVGNLPASKITSGTFDSARLPDLATSDITSGTIDSARLPVIASANAAITSTTSTNVTVADESTDTTCFPLFVTAATGDLAPKSGSNLSFNSSSGALSATSFDGDGSTLSNLNATKLATGTIADARIPNLAASKITSGVFDSARIPVTGDITAAKITSGILDSARLPAGTFGGGGGGTADAIAADNIQVGDAAINLTTNTGNITIDAQGNNTDIIFKGTDGGVDRTFLTLDGSEAGKATFLSEIVSTGLQASGDTFIDSAGGFLFDVSQKALQFGDNYKATFGADSDLLIRHTGSGSIIEEKGTGSLVLRTNDQIQIDTRSGTEVMAKFIKDGAAELYYNSLRKVMTDSDGMRVMGILNQPSGIILEDPSNTAYGGHVTFYDGTSPEVFTNGDVVIGGRNNNTRLKNIIMSRDDTSVRFTGDVQFDSAGGILFDLSDKALEFGDNYKASFGAGGDLQIFHDGSNTFLKENGTGSLLVQASFMAITKTDGSSNMAKFFNDGQVELYHNAVERFETTDSGATIFGNRLTITSTDSDATAGPTIDLQRDRTAVADQDFIGQVTFSADNEAAEKTTYAKILSKIIDASDGTEDANLNFSVISNGSQTTVLSAKGNGDITFTNKDVLLSTNVDLKFEGANANAHETTLTVTDPTGDNTITLPDATGTVILNTGGTFTGDVAIDSAGGFLFDVSDKALELGDNYKITLPQTTNALQFGTSNGSGGVDVLDLNNENITGVNRIKFADAGVNEGLDFNSRIKLYEAPNNLTNAAGNLQIVYNNVRKFTVSDSGAEVVGNLIGDSATFSGEVNASVFVGSGASLTSIPAGQLTGTIDNARISLDAAEIPNLAASKITSGTLDSARVPVMSIGAGNITSGTLDSARLPVIASANTANLAATATALATARNIGGVSFDGTGNIDLPGVNSAGNQNTSGTAAIATSITAVANNSTDETVYLTFVDGATGTQGIETDTGLTYNPSTGLVTATKFSGDGSALTGISAGVSEGIFLEYQKRVVGNYNIDAGVTALTACNDSDGIEIISGVTVTISDSSGWVITGGDKNMGLDAMVATSNQTERTMRTGTIKPTLNNTYDLGDSAVAWRNIYTNDLNLSNETGGGNDVDGTTGKWTIQEGEENLYIINRKTGKKYKFMLEEIV